MDDFTSSFSNTNDELFLHPCRKRVCFVPFQGLVSEFHLGQTRTKFLVFSANPTNWWDPVWVSFLPNRKVFRQFDWDLTVLFLNIEMLKSVRRLLDVNQVELALMRIFNNLYVL